MHETTIISGFGSAWRGIIAATIAFAAAMTASPSVLAQQEEIVARVDGQGETQPGPAGELLQMREDLLEVLVVLAYDHRLPVCRGRLAAAPSNVLIDSPAFNFLDIFIHVDQL